jgi:hypothetical protein
MDYSIYTYSFVFSLFIVCELKIFLSKKLVLKNVKIQEKLQFKI